MRVFRFLKALVKYIIFGNRVSFNEFVYRIRVCDACPNSDKEKWKCKICKCYLDKKAKWSTEDCPEKRW